MELLEQLVGGNKAPILAPYRYPGSQLKAGFWGAKRCHLSRDGTIFNLF
jgi:hypothetical protein